MSPMTTDIGYEEFANTVRRFRLTPRKCSATHWQILEGREAVNVWPNTKRGFRFQAAGHAVQSGTIGEAVTAAGPTIAGPAAPWEDEAEIPVSKPLPHVGLIRWLWRWLW